MPTIGSVEEAKVQRGSIADIERKMKIVMSSRDASASVAVSIGLNKKKTYPHSMEIYSTFFVTKFKF